MGAAPGVQRVGEVLISLVAVADDGARVAGQDTAGVDGFFGPVPGVHRGEELSAGDMDIMQVPGDPGGGLVGVQHPAACSSTRTWSMNGPSRAAALPRIPAVNPAETPTPVSAATSFAARATGR